MSEPTDGTHASSLSALVQEGAKLYNEGAYWEAHEAWEEAWLELREDGCEQLADLLQALILATAAFENLDRGKPRGFARQGAKALHRLRAHGHRLQELGVAEGTRFNEELLDVYLHVQRQGIGDLEELEAAVPRLAVRSG